MKKKRKKQIKKSISEFDRYIKFTFKYGVSDRSDFLFMKKKHK